MAEIRLITFDLDNTLWDVGQVIRHAERSMYAWLDSEVPDNRQVMDPDTLIRIRAEVVAAHPELGHDVSALREAVLYRGMLLCGFDEPGAKAHARTAFEAFFEARQQVTFFEHALESLAMLAEHYQLAALTNGNADVAKIGLDRYFSFAFSSADVAASKPAPDIFHAALARAGVSAGESVHVGDNLVDDIHGAGNVGMHTIWVKHAEPADTRTDTRPSEVVEHLSELPDAVDRIHRR
jgi:putative hydrolase of the HAD superfamily